MQSRIAVAVVVVVASSCSAPAVINSPVATVLPDECGTWLCQTNSASLGDKLRFHELDQSMKGRNAAGIRFVGLHNSSGDLQLDVKRDQLTATDKNGSYFARKSLEGATLALEALHEDGTLELFDVRIKTVGTLRYWIAPELEPTETLELEYRSQGNPERWQPVCAGKDISPEWAASSGTTTTLALVFTGDRYDAKAKTVTSGTSPWFNIVCAGSALAKLHLLRHTMAAIAADATREYSTTTDQRQAMLKMLTDDICGTGYSFTVDGEPLYYQDRNGWHPFVPGGSLPPNARLEGVWNKDGAVCLDEPRRLVEKPAIAGEIAAECKTNNRAIPTCQTLSYTATNLAWINDDHVISVNPP